MRRPDLQKKFIVLALWAHTHIVCASHAPRVVKIRDDSFEVHIGDRRVGFADFTHNDDTITIDLITVLKNQQRKGFGRLLFMKILDEALEHHVRIVTLDAKPLGKEPTSQQLADWYVKLFREWEQEHLSHGGPQLDIKRTTINERSIKLTTEFKYRNKLRT